LYRKILESDESNEMARSRLVGVLLEEDKTDEALNELQELKNYSSDTDRLDFAIGRIYLLQVVPQLCTV